MLHFDPRPFVAGVGTTAALLLCAACAEEPTACVGQTGCQCAADAECLGDRRCEAGVCGEPPAGSTEGTADDVGDSDAPADDGDGDDSGTPAAPMCRGLSDAPMEWTVPHPTVSDIAGASALGWYLLIDLHGDGLADLVVTEPPGNATPEAFIDRDGPHWWIYRNTGHGFADSAERWAVPHPSVADTGGVHAMGLAVLLDLQGDGLSDLVYTGAHPVDAGRAFGDADHPHWLVYRNDGSGFASDPETWSVPHPSFARTDGLAATGRYLLLDLTGKGRADLVVTHPPPADADEAFGTDAPHWLVYENTASGFANSTSQWSVPHRTVAEAFGNSALGFGAVLSLSGDAAPDLVFTHPPASDDAFPQGDGHGWLVYPNGGHGFTDAPKPWSVPHRSVSATAGSTALGATSVLDLRGRGRPQLVVTHAPSADQAFGDPPHWLAYDSDDDGFLDSPEPFTVPHATVADLGGFSALGEHVLMSLDGDRCPALVVTAPPDIDAAFGSADHPHWLVYPPLPTP